MADVVLYFASNADTMIATKALKDAGIIARMIPKPASVAAASNLCLSIDATVETPASNAIRSANIALGGVMK